MVYITRTHVLKLNTDLPLRGYFFLYLLDSFCFVFFVLFVYCLPRARSCVSVYVFAFVFVFTCNEPVCVFMTAKYIYIYNAMQIACECIRKASKVTEAKTN